MAADIEGKAGKAWQFKISPEERARKPHGLEAWLVYQPGVHAFWSWWLITGCDLYDDDVDPTAWGRLPPKKSADDVTHEFVCYALNPEDGFFAGSEPPDGWDATETDAPARVGRHLLTPFEFVHQERLRDSDQANEIMRLLVRAVCDGLTAADADFRARNIQMLSATAEHFRQGMHEVH